MLLYVNVDLRQGNLCEGVPMLGLLLEVVHRKEGLAKDLQGRVYNPYPLIVMLSLL